MNKEEQFEQLWEEAIKEALEQSHESISIPDPSESWIGVQRKLAAAARRKRILRSVKYFGIVAASLTIGSILFGQPFSTGAFNPVSVMFKNVKDQTVSLYYGVDQHNQKGAKTPPPPDYNAFTDAQSGGGPSGTETESSSEDGGGVMKSVVATLEEVRKKADFTVFSPSYIPEGYKLDKITMYMTTPGDKVKVVHMAYTDHNDNLFYITLDKLEPNTVMSSSSFQKELETKNVELPSGKAILTLLVNDRSKIEWLYANIYVTMSGKLSEEEIVKVAKSLK